MDFVLFEYFLRVAEIGSINRAATSLQLSQPALSRHISTLEGEIGSTLFKRTRSGVHLTAAGKFLSDRVRPLLRQFAMLKEQVGEQAAGQFAIGTPPAWQAVFTSPFIARSIEEQPNVKLRVYEGLSNVLKDYMSAGLLDVGVVPFSAHPTPGYKQTSMLREPIVVVGHAEESLSSAHPMPLSYLQGRSLALPERPNVLRVQLEHAGERRQVKFRVIVETDTLGVVFDMARRGLALAVVPVSSIYGVPDDDSLSWSPLRGHDVTWSLWENEARTHSQAVLEGKSLVLKVLSEVLARKTWFRAEGLAGLRAHE